MSLEFRDSFDHYATADAAGKYGAAFNAGITINSSAGRNGTAGLRISTSGNVPGPKITLSGNIATVIYGIAFNASAPIAEQCLVSFYDAGTRQATLNLQTDGKVNFRRGSTGSGTLVATSTNPITLGSYQYLEIKVTFHNTTGTLTVRQGGLALAGMDTLTGLNTRSGTNNYCNEVFPFGDGTGGSSNFRSVDADDLYVFNGLGSQCNDFAGDVRVQAIFPSGAGNHTDWTPSTGTNHGAVDESTPNSDTDYNHSSTANQIDTFAMGDLSPTAGTIYSVSVLFYGRKDDGGVRQVQSAVRSGGSDAFGTTRSLGTTYAYYVADFELDPASAAWTVSSVNAIEAGYKLIA